MGSMFGRVGTLRRRLIHPHHASMDHSGGAAISSAVKRRCLHVAAVATALLLVAGACASPAPVTGPAAVHGLVVLTQPRGQLEAWIGTDRSEPVLNAVPEASGVEAMAISANGRIATVDGGGHVRVSDPVTSDVADLAVHWRDLQITGVDPEWTDAPLAFPSWDPAGARIAFVSGEAGLDLILLIVDAETGVAQSFQFPSYDAYIPIWIGEDEVAVSLLRLEPDFTSLPTTAPTSLIDLTSGTWSDGPARRALAASPDGRYVLTTEGIEIRQLDIQTTDAWLNGSASSVATLAKPAKSGSPAFAFDASGSRVAIAWWTDPGSSASDFVQVFAESSGWSATGSTPAVKDVSPTAVAWLP